MSDILYNKYPSKLDMKVNSSELTRRFKEEKKRRFNKIIIINYS